MKTITLIMSIIKIIPIFIIGTANAVIYWIENAGFDAIAQITPTDKDNKAILWLKDKATYLRKLGEKLNGWVKKLGL